MMREHDFDATAFRDGPRPADLALEALWWQARGDWDAAHRCVQSREGEPRCDWVHAYLHRVEGDIGNAGYWYARAGQPVATGPFDAEWAAIARALTEAASTEF